MKKIIVFVDSDVIISSLLSTKGASYLLLNEVTSHQLTISQYSQKEIELVAQRLQIPQVQVIELLANRITIHSLKESLGSIKTTYAEYVHDLNDSHIVGGAVASNAEFLITFNKKDFKHAQIKESFGITILSPGQFLQFLQNL